MTQFLERCRSFAQHEGIDYGLLDSADAPERALRDYLVRRSTRQASPSIPSAQHAVQHAGIMLFSARLYGCFSFCVQR